MSSPSTSKESQFDDLAVPIRNLKIICAALIAGVVFLGVMFSSTIDFERLGVELKLLVLMASSVGLASVYDVLRWLPDAVGTNESSRRAA